MNHVPDDALAALDALGRGALEDEPRPVRARLRSDLRLRVPCDDDALRAGATRIEFRVDHTRREDRLRGYGSYVETIVDGVEQRLRAWGFTPPDTYEYREGEDGWYRYAGELELL